MEIGGKAFQVVDLERRTVRHDARIKAVLARTGILDALREHGASDEQFAAALHRVIIEQEAAVDLAALFLAPDGVEWSVLGYAETVAFLNGCSTESDRFAVEQLAFDRVCGFFQLRLRWVETLLVSLSLPQPDQPVDQTEAA